jgi:hypothetical protein
MRRVASWFAPNQLQLYSSNAGVTSSGHCRCANAAAAVPGSDAARAEAATVTFRAPDGLSDVYTMSGRHISIDVDRLVHVSERDAVPLRQAGWQELENEVLANA